MLITNETIAEKFYWLEAPFIYRVHESPEQEKISELNTYLYNFGYKIKGSKDNIYPKAFAEVLDNINEHHVHRSELESALKSRLIVDFGVLARYDISVGEHFYEYLISRVEVEQIMHSLIFMTAGKEIKFNLPEFFYEHTKIDLKNLNKIIIHNCLLMRFLVLMLNI